MKFPLKPVAVAVALGLASAAAQAQLAAPGIPTNTAAPVNGLYLSVFDTATLHSELVNLGYLFTDISAGAPGSPFTPNSQTTPFTQTSDPSGGGGQVLQLNWGVIPGFTSTFPTVSSTTLYDVMLTNGAAQSSMSVSYAPGGGIAGAESQGAVTLVTGNVNGLESAWSTALPNASEAIDTTGNANYNANGGNEQSGSFGLTGNTFATGVGGVLDFYNITKVGRTTVSTTPYANTQGNGFWFLSNTGDLTWNVPLSGAPVPLPAAVWLLISGLAGLGAIGRRRWAAAAA